MSFRICDGEPGPGFWELETAHFPAGMSRHLWELLMPPYEAGSRRGFVRYGSFIDHMDMARIKGRVYTKSILVENPQELGERRAAAENALANRLWREDRESWPRIRENFRSRLLLLARAEPGKMDSASLVNYLIQLRTVFIEGACQHFAQQPASTIPVGDWLRQTCEHTGAPLSEVVTVLRDGRQPADFLESLDAVAAQVRNTPEAMKLIWNSSGSSSDVIGRLRAISTRLKALLDSYLDEYADRLVTGFDLTDATMRELPESIVAILRSRLDRVQEIRSMLRRETILNGLRDRVPHRYRTEFDDGLSEAVAAYGLHDEDVKITYLWPLGLMRRAMLAAASRLQSSGALHEADHIFQTTPEELDALLREEGNPSAEELAGRVSESNLRIQNEPPLTFGSSEDEMRSPTDNSASTRIDRAMNFYLDQMETRRHAGYRPEWILVDGIAASPGRYEGYARVVRGPSDFKRMKQGDVLVVRSTSAAYNLLLPLLGAVVTDRGGALCHSAIIAREFGIPAVVGTNQGTTLIPDGARILVDGDHGFVAVRS